MARTRCAGVSHAFRILLAAMAAGVMAASHSRADAERPATTSEQADASPAAPSKPSATKASKFPKLHIDAVVWQGARRRVTIDGTVYKEGDVLEHVFADIVRITTDGVIIRAQDNHFLLRKNGPAQYLPPAEVKDFLHRE